MPPTALETTSKNDQSPGNVEHVTKAKNGVAAVPTSAEAMRMEHHYGAHNHQPFPVVFDKGLGARVWDPEGQEYIDMLSAHSAVNQGHCHPRIVAALYEQAGKLTLSSRAFYNSVFPRFAQTVTEMFGYDMVLPVNTGTEAVETAIKLARKWAYTKKGVPDGNAVVLSVEGNFHGRTLGIISMSTDPNSRTGFGPYLEGVGPMFLDGDELRTIRFNDVGDLERALELNGENVAAFLVEPIQGDAGFIVADDGYLMKVHELCKKHNVLLICDDIQTGLCRTGKMLACDYDDVRPDVVLLGKALSGGVYPVSVVLADRDVMLCIKPGEHGGTYGGNPLGCAVALAALQVLSVRGRGLLNAVVIDDSKSTRGRTAWQLCLLLKSRGVLAKPAHGNIVRFAPPLVIAEADILRAVKIIDECLTDLDELEEIPGEVARD
ncbi:ornithine-oxo-acid aminotransferase [Mycena leptocephala]|nr:ornithine-oxo-acid aminotransferase [Mycena leptocephala]